MKRIVKQDSPLWFEAWKTEFEETNHRKAHYKQDFSTDDKEGAHRRRKLKKELAKEQGQICCYCMNRLRTDASHIEHFWPKERFLDRDLDYGNLLVSCNGEGSMIFSEEHCGHRKNNWWRKDMVSPTDAEIEKMFQYSPNGKIHGTKGRETSNIAQEMIANFGLDSYHLERNRRQAIENSEVFDEEEYTAEDIRSFIDYYSNMDNGAYVPYCKAIIDCLEDMLGDL